MTHSYPDIMMNDSRQLDQAQASTATANIATVLITDNNNSAPATTATHATAPQAPVINVNATNLQLIPTAVLTQTETARAAWRQIFNQRAMTQNRTQLSTTRANARENLPWGDILDCKESHQFRLYSVNINGIQLDKDGGKFDEFCHVLNEIQGDIGCIQEHNLDTTHSYVRTRLNDTAKHRWQWRRLTYASTPISFARSYKPGGTMIISAGSSTSRIIDSGGDKWGRWTYQTFQGNGQTIITILSAYQVVDSATALQGATTAAAQQRALLIQGKDATHDPRKAFRRDLTKTLQAFQHNGHEIILVGDFNEKFTDDDEGMSKIAAECELIDVMKTVHPYLTETPTYARGRTRLDYALATPRIVTTVERCGYEPFNHRITSDHRTYFIDLDATRLFGTPIQEMARYSGRGLHANNLRQVTAYIQRKHEILSSQNAFVRAARLAAPGNRHLFAERLDRDLLQASVGAEKSVRPIGEPQWSIKLMKARQRVTLLKQLLSMHKNRIDLTDQIRAIGRDIEDDFIHPTTVAECSQLLRKASRDVYHIVEEHHQHRETERNIQIATLEATGKPADNNHARILRILKKAESIQMMFKKLRNQLNPAERQSVTRVEVPVNEQEDPKQCQHWKVVDIPSEVLEHLQRRNRKHFGQAYGTPFTIEPLVGQFGYSGISATATQVLDGEYTPAEGSDDNVNAILAHMAKKNQQDRIKLQSEIQREAFISKLKSWRESTATSPSGLHLGHYRAMVSRHSYSNYEPTHPDRIRLDQMQADLVTFHLRLLNYALRRGYSYKRWQQVVNTMLWKEAGNIKIHRTRVIHLYEADYNLALSLKWREALFAAERTQSLADGQYGSRPRRSSYDPVLLEVLQAEMSRITRKSFVQMNFDATSCYDRIIPSIATMASQTYGVPESVAQANVTTLEHTTYRLRTGLGVSETGYRHCDEYPIYGTGQGSGNSPVIWCFVSSILFNCYNDRVHGAQYAYPDRTGDMSIKMVGFVDDSNGQTNCFHSDDQRSTEVLLAQTRHDIQVWNDILWASGGALELPKCSYQLMHWQFTAEGVPILAGGTSGLDLQIDDSHCGNQRQQSISQLSAHSAHKTLGHYMTPSGNQSQQFNILKKKSDAIAMKLLKSPLTRHEAWTYYFAMYLPSIGYPLPMTHFTRDQLHRIQQKALSAIIARCGYNRNTHRAIIFGSTKYGGANFRHLYSIQGAGQVQLFLKFWRTPLSQAGKLLRISVSWLQLAAGISSPIFEAVNPSIAYCDSKWLLSLRSYLCHIGGSLRISPTFVPPLEREYDHFIMDEVIHSTWFNPREIKLINLCRLYLQVLLISDITNVTGTHLDKFMAKGEVDHRKSGHTAGHRFVQDRPPARVWTLWRKANLLWSDEHGRLRQPLGAWKGTSTADKSPRRRLWPTLQLQNVLYVRRPSDGQQYRQYHRQGPARTFHRTAQIISHTDLPSNANPVDARRQFPVGYRVLHNETMELPPVIAVPSASSFPEYVSHLDKWESELLQVSIVSSALTAITNSLDKGLIIVCDGSVNQYEAGSFGWVASTSDGTRLATCSGPARGSRLTSYRAEGYGVLSVVRFIYNMHQYTGLPLHVIHLTIACDNKSMVRRVTQLIPDDGTHFQVPYTLEALQPEWDILNEIWYTIKGWRPFQMQHVKGHQDRVHRAHALSLHAQLNIEADALATQYLRQSPYPKREVLMFPHSHVHFQIGNSTITYRYSRRLRNEEHDRITIPYLKKKYQWTDQVLESINWEVHGKAIRSQRLNMIHTVKLVNDILPTNKVQHRWNTQHDANCPRCHNAIETRDHILRCEKSAEWRIQFHHTLRQMCERLNTHPGLNGLLQRGLLEWFRGNEVMPVEGYPDDFVALIYSQNAIGWRQLFNGKWSTHWARIQGAYAGESQDHETSVLGDKWNVAIIQTIWVQWGVLWKTRNETVHGNDLLTRKAAEMEILKRRMRAVYALDTRVEPAVAYVFRQPMEEHLAKGAHYVTNWLAIYDPLVRESAKRATARDIQGMRPLTEYFGMHIDDPG